MNIRLPTSLVKATLLAATLSLLTGCAYFRTGKSHYAGMDNLLGRTDYGAAIQQIEKAKHKGYAQKDRAVYYLDMGMLHHLNGEYGKSNEFLEQAERSIEDNFTKSLTLSAGSLLLNDNVLPYAGEAYEDIYLNVFKALNYLSLNQPDEAFVELRRVNNKLLLLEDKYKKVAEKLNKAEDARETFRPGKSHFQNSALGRYLSMLLYRNDGKWDDVRIDREKIDLAWKLQPDVYTFSQPDLSPVTASVSPPRARVNVIAFGGLSPDKTADTLYLHTEENLVIISASSEGYWGEALANMHIIPWPGANAGYHFKVQLPHMKKRPSRVARITVDLGSETKLELQRIESLENVAVETFEIKKPLIYLKTITRAVVKGLAAEAGKAEMTEGVDDELLSFLIRIFTDIAIDITENADLRMSRFFPAEAYVGEAHIQEGVYPVTIRYYDYGNHLLLTDERGDVKIEAGRLNVVQSAYLN
ncbi:MAG: hypothetical protein K9M45_03230 [Kiritimatiellales bacterium]|nr:hypothetical protein [Kiritimatiellales bacterium]